MNYKLLGEQQYSSLTLAWFTQHTDESLTVLVDDDHFRSVPDKFASDLNFINKTMDTGVELQSDFVSILHSDVIMKGSNVEDGSIKTHSLCG